jgi:hypothetical protein
LKLKALRKLVREGAAALRRGACDEVDAPGLDVYLDRLAVPAQR